MTELTCKMCNKKLLGNQRKWCSKKCKAKAIRQKKKQEVVICECCGQRIKNYTIKIKTE